MSVRLALKFVMQNVGDFVDVLQLHVTIPQVVFWIFEPPSCSKYVWLVLEQG